MTARQCVQAPAKRWGQPGHRGQVPARRPLAVGVDGSAPARRALEWTLREAAGRGAPVRVVTVWTWDGVAGGSAARLRQVTEMQEALVADVLSALPADQARRIRQAGLTTEVAQGDPATRLIELSSDADLLVLASHGDRVVQPTLIGSVAEVCMRHASCPVVVVPAHPQPVLRDRGPVVGAC